MVKSTSRHCLNLLKQIIGQSTLILLLAISIAIPVTAIAAEPIKFKIKPSGSSLNFTATQNNAPVRGEFRKFSGDIIFSPDALEQSRIVITVDMTSLTASYEDAETTLKTKDWFNIENFPKAVFEAESFKSLGGKQYEASGTLTITDIKKPITLSFTLDKFSKTSASASGEVTIKRNDFLIGWSDTTNLQDEVSVAFNVNAVAKK